MGMVFLWQGKWCVWLPRVLTSSAPSHADLMWQTVATATAEGNLPSAYSVAVKPHADLTSGPPPLLCIYLNDFSDRAAVAAVLSELRRHTTY